MKNASKHHSCLSYSKNSIVWTKFDCAPAVTIYTMKNNVLTVIACSYKIFSTKRNIWTKKCNDACNSRARTKKLIWYPRRNFVLKLNCKFRQNQQTSGGKIFDFVFFWIFRQGEPETIAKLEKTSNDDHARRLARLEWELKQVIGWWWFGDLMLSQKMELKFQRKELAAMCKELEKQKELVAQDNEMKTNLRDSLKPRLDALLKVTIRISVCLDGKSAKKNVNHYTVNAPTTRSTEHELWRGLESTNNCPLVTQTVVFGVC